MVFQAEPTDQLGWGDDDTPVDYHAANRGQWFLGVLDTHHKKVYLVASDLETPDAIERETGNRRALTIPEIYVSRPRPGIPAGGWTSAPLRGRADQGINSAPRTDTGGLRQHGRVVRAYECAGPRHR